MAYGDEHEGDYYEGEHVSERTAGISNRVVVAVFKRRNSTHFFRVSLRSISRPQILSRYELDVDTYTSERDFLKAVAIAGGALAEHGYNTYGDNHDPVEIAKAACQVASDLLHDMA